MNTLHLCHWQNIDHLSKHLKLLSAADSLLIFGEINDLERQEIYDLLQEKDIKWYLVIERDDPNIPDSGIKHEINHNQWLELVIEHNNTYAWK